MLIWHHYVNAIYMPCYVHVKIMGLALYNYFIRLPLDRQTGRICCCNEINTVPRNFRKIWHFFKEIRRKILHFFCHLRMLEYGVPTLTLTTLTQTMTLKCSNKHQHRHSFTLPWRHEHARHSASLWRCFPVLRTYHLFWQCKLWKRKLHPSCKVCWSLCMYVCV